MNGQDDAVKCDCCAVHATQYVTVRRRNDAGGTSEETVCFDCLTETRETLSPMLDALAADAMRCNMLVQQLIAHYERRHEGKPPPGAH